MKTANLFKVFTVTCLLGISSMLSSAALAAASTTGNWATQVSGLDIDINDVCFVNSSAGWAAGAEGKLIKTTDCGATWTEQSSGITADINSIFFIDIDTGWIGADGGVIRYTSDGGATWQDQTTPTTNNVYDIEFSGTTVGYAFCRTGKVLKTDDGGSTWEAQSTGLLNWVLAGAVIDANTIYAGTTSGHILHTSDGGTTWIEQTAPAEIAGEESINGVCAVSTSDIWMVSNGDYIIHTTDGETWTAADSETGEHLNGVDFTDADSGWVIGDGGTILHTADGGASWTEQSTEITGDLLAIDMVDANLGYAVGAGGTILCYRRLPQAAFSTDVNSALIGGTIAFTDESINDPVSWSWDFGDGSTSSEQNPAHVYESAGTYTVSLTVTNSAGSDDEVKTNHIAISLPAPVAGFSADVTSADTDDTVTFTDQSANSPTSWEWDFGDGDTSTEQNPAHIYTDAGTYTVTLTVTNSTGSDDEVKTDYITIARAASSGCRKGSAASVPEIAFGWGILGMLGAATSYLHIRRKNDK